MSTHLVAFHIAAHIIERITEARARGDPLVFDDMEICYDGLYVAMPWSSQQLGVNPSLTIAALALRIADRIAREW